MKIIKNDKKIRRTIESSTSSVEINYEKNVIKKKIKNYKNYNVYEREIYFLKYLNEKGFNWCPQLIDTNDFNQTITMTWVGERINKTNAPIDWEEQLQSILNDLGKQNIKHNDIKGDEVLVLNGNIMLIDFGWASINGDWGCGINLCKKEKPANNFPDETAIKRIKKILN